MSRPNPRIDAQRRVLLDLVGIEFDVDAYNDTTFVDDNWKPSFHYYQGLENFRAQVQDRLNRLDQEEKEWLAKQASKPNETTNA